MIGKYPTQSLLICSFRDFAGDADLWHDTLELWFTVADALLVQGLPVPSEWEYNPRLAARPWKDSQPTEEERDEFLEDHMEFGSEALDATYSDLLYAGRVISKYAELIRADHSY